VQQQPVQQPVQQQPAEQTRRQVVAGASGETTESVAQRPRAVLPATGTSETLAWLMLTLASLLIAIGAGVRFRQLRRS
jgi:LPXTG-motif cell wall-anchored protein